MHAHRLRSKATPWRKGSRTSTGQVVVGREPTVGAAVRPVLPTFLTPLYSSPLNWCSRSPSSQQTLPLAKVKFRANPSFL